MNRFCECLECDAVYESQHVIGKVRDENVFTYCSIECESDADIRAAAQKQKWDALDEEVKAQLNITEVPKLSEDSPKNLNDVMAAFVKAQGMSE